MWSYLCAVVTCPALLTRKNVIFISLALNSPTSGVRLISPRWMGKWTLYSEVGWRYKMSSPMTASDFVSNLKEWPKSNYIKGQSLLQMSKIIVVNLGIITKEGLYRIYILLPNDMKIVSPISLWNDFIVQNFLDRDSIRLFHRGIKSSDPLVTEAFATVGSDLKSLIKKTL